MSVIEIDPRHRRITAEGFPLAIQNGGAWQAWQSAMAREQKRRARARRFDSVFYAYIVPLPACGGG
jgi:hypothetical protein